MDDLKTRRVTLEKELKRKEDAHAQKFGGGSLSESAYQDSCREINAVYDQLSVVCEELGDPIPLRF
jgi:hypothetical protein